MKRLLSNSQNLLLPILLFGLGIIVAIFLVEGSLAIYWQRSFLVRQVPPLSVQTHVTADYDVEYHYNSLGLRGAEFSPAQVYDLVLLGDSFLFGQGVPYENSIGGLLQARGLAVLNMSEIGTNPHFHLEKLIALKQRGLKAKLYILGLFWGNDFQGYSKNSGIEQFINALEQTNSSYSAFSDYFRLSRLRFLFGSALTKLTCRECLLLHSYRFQQPFQTDWIDWYTRGDKDSAVPMRKGEIGVVSESEYMHRANLNHESLSVMSLILRRISLATQGKLLVIHIPDLHFVRLELGQDYRSLVRKFIRGLPEISQLDFHERGLTSADYFPGDGHWNAEGHKKIMSALVEYLETQK